MFLGVVISQSTTDYAYYYNYNYTTDYNSTYSTSSFNSTTYDYPVTSATDQPGSVGFSILIFL